MRDTGQSPSHHQPKPTDTTHNTLNTQHTTCKSQHTTCDMRRTKHTNLQHVDTSKCWSSHRKKSPWARLPYCLKNKGQHNCTQWDTHADTHTDWTWASDRWTVCLAAATAPCLWALLLPQCLPLLLLLPQQLLPAWRVLEQMSLFMVVSINGNWLQDIKAT